MCLFDGIDVLVKPLLYLGDLDASSKPLLCLDSLDRLVHVLLMMLKMAGTKRRWALRMYVVIS